MKLNMTPTPLAIGKRVTEQELAVISKEPSGTSLWEGDRLCGGHSTTIHSLFNNAASSWESCLGSTTAYSTVTGSPVMYFLSRWVFAEDVEKWCIFMNDVLNYHVRYLGEGYIPIRKYNGNTNDTSSIRSHIVALDYQKDLYDTCNRAVLSKVTLVRYIYRTDHLKNIIKPIYEIVESGISPWDAVFLAHRIAFTKVMESYKADRGLFFKFPNDLPILYPRSYDKVKEYFRQFGCINHVWGPKAIRTRNFGYVHAPELNALTSDYYFLGGYRHNLFTDAYHFHDPYVSIYLKRLNERLSVKDYSGALAIYKELLLETRPYYQIMLSNPVKAKLLLSKPFAPPYTGTTSITTDEYLKLILSFIESFENKTENQV